MRKRLMLVIALLTLRLVAAGSVRADGPAIGSSPPSLGSVVWGGQGTSFESLKGKTVVVITYVTWCPICNGWSKEALGGLPKEIAAKPVVVLAISTDTPPEKAQAYLKERGVVGPQILPGYDPTIATRFGFTNKFFNYAIIGPDSKKELAAKRVYDDLMKLPVADPGRQAGLRNLTKKFPDTHYGKVASGVDVDE